MMLRNVRWAKICVLVILRTDRDMRFFLKSTVVTANAMQGYINFKYLRTNVGK